MSNKIELTAETRSDIGKGASRRLRRMTGNIPGIVYGGRNPAISVTLAEKQLNKAMEQESFYSQILNVTIDGADQQAVVRDLQRHPATNRVMHIDFLRIRADRVIQMSVPLHFLNEDTCPGVKLEGGSVSRSLTEIEVSCLPADLPEFLEVDMGEADIGTVVHLSDVALPEGVTSVALELGPDHDSPVASVQAPRAVTEVEEDEAAAAEGEEGSEAAGEGGEDTPDEPNEDG